MPTQGSIIAGAVASALWLLLGGAFALLVWFAAVPVDALRLVLPEVVPVGSWYRAGPWMIATPLLSALLFGAIVALVTQVVARGTAGVPRGLVFAAVWLGAIGAGLVVGGTSALADTIADWPPPRASFALHGWSDTIAPALYGSVVWGWVPAVVAIRTRARVGARRSTTLIAVLALALAVATVTLGVAARTTDGLLPPAVTQPLPSATPVVTPPAASVDAPIAPADDWCTWDDLAFRDGGGTAATGHRVEVIVVTNVLAVPCVLPGYPDLAFADAAGDDLHTAVVPGGGFLSEDRGPGDLVVQPGAEAATWITWDAAASGPGEIGSIWIAPWPGAVRGVLGFPHGADIANGAAVAVTAWQPFTGDPFGE